MKTKFAALSALLLLTCSAAWADTERILSYDSRIVVDKDGSLTVREDIRVISAGDQIKHGIYRDFPVIYAGGLFTARTVGFKVLEVRRDENREDYRVEDEGEFKRVYIGNKDVMLKDGEHAYSLVYKTDRQLGFFRDHDELYWNVTGNGWAFPIDSVSCTVVLPKDIPRDRLKLEAYTGRAGDKGKDFASSVADAGEALFKATRKFEVGEGLTVVAGWPKGFIQPPGSGSASMRFFCDNPVVCVAALGFMAVFLYFLVAWFLVGRDPEKGIIIPLFQPPDGMSPPAVRYLTRMGFDDACFSTALIDAAVKGHVKILEDEKAFTLERGNAKSGAPLPPEEEAVVQTVLKSAERIALDNTHYTRFEEAQKGLKGALSAQHEDSHFRTHLGAFIPGLALSGLTIVAAGLAQLLFGDAGKAGGFFFICLWLSFWSMGVYMLARLVASAWRNVGRGNHKVAGGFSAMGITLFSLPFFGGEVLGLVMLVAMSSLLMAPILLGIVLLNVLFHFLLKAPTVEGRELMDKIDGFRMYLVTAEGDVLSTLRPPEQTPELFERYLPYAIALGVANEWCRKFTEVLAAAGRGTSGGYSPGWYHGTSSSWNAVGAAGFATALAGGFAAALSSASTAPGSSSGGGGGGSSGGGGGGGSGGGW